MVKDGANFFKDRDQWMNAGSTPATNDLIFFDWDSDGVLDHVGIVTNDYHVFRSLALAKKQGIVHVCGIAAGATPWYLPNNMARESFALIKDVVF